MLDSLDTLIAFTLIFTVVSLLTTIAVQIVSSLLNLRGWNVAQGFSEALHTINPTLNKRTKALANHILSGRMVADSCLPSGWPLSWRRWATAVRPDEAFNALHRLATGQKTTNTVLLQNAAGASLQPTPPWNYPPSGPICSKITPTDAPPGSFSGKIRPKNRPSTSSRADFRPTEHSSGKFCADFGPTGTSSGPFYGKIRPTDTPSAPKCSEIAPT